MSFVLIDDAKVRRVLPDSKYSGEIFSELLRQGIKDATKGGLRAKSCREQRILPNYFVVSEELFTFAAETLFIYLNRKAYEKEKGKKIGKKLLSW